MNLDKQETNRTLLTKVLIILIIIVIFCLWLANLRNVFKSQSPATDSTWKNISTDIDKTWQQIDNNSETASSSSENSFVEDLLDRASSSATSTATSSTVKLEDKLNDLITTATSTVKKDNCPPYINCMPTIGDAKPCIIPAGCEGVTQIAY